MLFTSVTFMVFHVLVASLRWALPRRLVEPMLLVSSYLFYLSWGPQYGLLIGALTLVPWLAARAIERYRSRRKLVLGLTVAGVLATLSYFKYANFLVAQWAALMQRFGVHQAPHHFDIVLPLAISFYSFEVISYVIDVYRGEPAEKSLWRFALYVAYYPHLIAGPIVRAHELLPQLRTVQPFDGEVFCEGVFIALVGYLKKIVLADNLSPWADAVFAQPGQYSTFGTWIGVLAYTGQIYCDFSGYTDIARGASMTLGYPLPENFDYPYLSRSITEFWRRWHMTLSRWLRDYLYISLGGNRRGRFNQYRNLFLTMLLGGLWHGANWTFVVWGGLHGGLLALHKLWDTVIRRVPGSTRVRSSLPYQVFALALTLFCVIIGWVFFRAPDFDHAALVLGRMFRDVPGQGAIADLGHGPEPMGTAGDMLIALLIGHVLGHYRIGLRSNRALPAIGRGLLWFGIIAVCYVYSEARAQFIYFQF